MKSESKRIYAYLRVSGKGQLGNDSFDRQLETIEKFSKKEGYKVERVFKEQVSGTKNELRRPIWNEMIAYIVANGVKTIIVEDLKRFARAYLVQEQLLIYLASKDITLIVANTGENITQALLEDPAKKLIIQIFGVVSEYDKSQLVIRLRHARDKIRKETGHCEGPKPYGDTQEEKDVIKKMRYLRRRKWKEPKKGKTYKEIVEILNKEGFKTRQGKDWTISTVYRILNKTK